MSNENNTPILPTDISSNFSHVIVAVEPELNDISFVSTKPTTTTTIGPLEIKKPISIGPLEIKTQEEPTDITPLIAPIMQEIAIEPNKILLEIDAFITALVPSASKFSVNLTPQEIAVITALVNDASGAILPQIKTTIEGLLKEDSKLSLHDIPQLVLLIAQLFQSNFFGVKNINLLNVIKYTLDSLLDSNILPIPGGLESVAKTIMDTSIELLNTTIPVVEEECWTIMSYLSLCFCKKK
jgi:hypothetical protein